MRNSQWRSVYCNFSEQGVLERGLALFNQFTFPPSDNQSESERREVQKHYSQCQELGLKARKLYYEALLKGKEPVRPLGTSPILKKDTVAKPEVFKHLILDQEASRTQETPSPFVRVDHNRDPTPILHEERSFRKQKNRMNRRKSQNLKRGGILWN